MVQLRQQLISKRNGGRGRNAELAWQNLQRTRRRREGEDRFIIYDKVDCCQGAFCSLVL
jgi:hypothetical protein